MAEEDKIMESFKNMENNESTLIAKQGGQKWNPFESLASTAKDVWYQTLFSGGGDFALIEKTLGSAGAHEFRLLTRYLSGSEKDMPLSENQDVIDRYLQGVHSLWGERYDIWEPTTNPELNPNTGIPYADEGWEFMQVSPKNIMYEAGIEPPYAGEGSATPSDWSDIYNKLGKNSTVRRRKLEGGDYEYMIVEPWDLIEGEKGKGGEWDLGGTDYAAESGFDPFGGGMKFSRDVPKAIGLLAKLAPDFVHAQPTTGLVGKKGYLRDIKRTNVSINLSDYGKDWLENKAKPFNITGTSIISSND